MASFDVISMATSSEKAAFGPLLTPFLSRFGLNPKHANKAERHPPPLGTYPPPPPDTEAATTSAAEALDVCVPFAGFAGFAGFSEVWSPCLEVPSSQKLRCARNSAMHCSWELTFCYKFFLKKYFNIYIYIFF